MSASLFDPYSFISAIIEAESHAIDHASTKYLQAPKMGKVLGAVGYVPDVVRAGVAAYQGDYDEVGRRSFSAGGAALGSMLGVGIGAWTGLAAPVVTPLLVGGFSYGGSLAGEAIYDHGLPALRWTGNTIEGGIRDYTQNTMSPYLQGLDLTHAQRTDR